MIETRLLQYFLTVAQEQSITGAARALHITQPTLSRQMALLEEQLGVTLFCRDSRPLALTDEGMLLRRRACEVLELLDKTEMELASCETQIEGTICVGCGELASVRLLTKLIAGFREQHPLVRFKIHTAAADRIKARMDDGRTDVGLLLEPVDVECYEYVRMPVRERWAALVPADSPLARQERVTAAELARFPMILPSRQKVYDEAASWFGAHYDSLQIIAVSNLSTNTALMVEAGLGCALTIEGALPFLNQASVRMIPLWPELTATSVLAWKRCQPFCTAMARFTDFSKCFLGMKEA
ncbi:MAG: LysR family transcriptional regulator [Candidatus Faecivicinus sp.]